MFEAHMYGPLISAGDVDAHVALLRDVFGMEEREVTELSALSARTLFGDGDGEQGLGRVRLVPLQTPGVTAGALLCVFTPASAEQIRTEETRLHRDAFRVIDFYAPDLDAAVAHARSLGHHVEQSEAGYDLDEGAFREAHLLGPDGVVTAFLSGPRDFFVDFAQVRDRVASEVCSISAPLGAVAGESVAFYRDVLGWDVVFEYAFEDDSFSELVGVQEKLKVTSSTVGFARNEPYINIVDYGTGHAGPSLVGQSVAPRRGLLGAVVTVTDLDEVRRRAPGAVGGEVTCRVAPLGEVRAAVLHPPHRIPHLLLQRL